MIHDRKFVRAAASLVHPLAGAEIGVIKDFIARNGGFRLGYTGPVVVSSIATQFRRPWIERAKTEAAALSDDWKRRRPPIFILGFWRSGTTLLHEFFATNPDFAAPTLLDVLFPADAPYLLRWKRRFVGAVLPPTRMTDSVALRLFTPQEEELALANLGAPSFFAASYCSDKYYDIAKKALFLEDDEQDRLRWMVAYDHFLKLLALKYPDRRLVLKNPANSTRIPELLELYPDALFIRIDRDKTGILPSFLRMQELGDAYFSLGGRFGYGNRRRDPGQSEEFYESVQSKLDKDWRLISKSRRYRIAYDDVVRNPVSEIRAAYGGLSIALTDEAASKAKRYWNRIAKQRLPSSGHALRLS